MLNMLCSTPIGMPDIVFTNNKYLAMGFFQTNEKNILKSNSRPDFLEAEKDFSESESCSYNNKLAEIALPNWLVAQHFTKVRKQGNN